MREDVVITQDDFYAPPYSKNSGRALSVTSVGPYVPLSCPGHNSKPYGIYS